MICLFKYAGVYLFVGLLLVAVNDGVQQRNQEDDLLPPKQTLSWEPKTDLTQRTRYEQPPMLSFIRFKSVHVHVPFRAYILRHLKV